GDMIDFLPAEWILVESWINWIDSNYEVSQYGVMGNHDYLYYNYPEIQGRFNRRLNNELYVSREIEQHLVRPAAVGDKKLYVRHAADFLNGREVLLIQGPDFDGQNQFHIDVIDTIDEKDNSITLKHAVQNDFSRNI